MNTKKAGTASGFAALPIWRKYLFHCYPWENRQFILFSFLQYLYFSVFHKHCAFQCFTETNGHRNNALNDICSKKNCNRVHFRLRHQQMHPAHGSIILKTLRRCSCTYQPHRFQILLHSAKNNIFSIVGNKTRRAGLRNIYSPCILFNFNRRAFAS